MKEQSFGLQIYHEYVVYSMRSGFKWMRYNRRGSSLTIWNLKMPKLRMSVVSSECANHFERWYKWMSSNPK